MFAWIGRIVVALAVLAVLGLGGLKIFGEQIARTVFQRALERNVGANPSADLPDGLHVYLCGTGSPLPDTTRAEACIGVLAGDKAYIFDAGSGSVRKLGRMGFPMHRLEGVFLTHLHSDHIDSLGELMLQSWVGRHKETPVEIYGPEGTAQVVEGFKMAYGLDRSYREAHHNAETLPRGGFGGNANEIILPAGPVARTLVIEDADLKIAAIKVNHAPVEPAFGYRIDYKGRSISLSGDTIYHQGFAKASEGVDIMFHEALNAEMVGMMEQAFRDSNQLVRAQIMHDIQSYHATPEDAAKAASEASAGQLVFYHVVPPLPSMLIYPMYKGAASSFYDGPIIIAEDGMIFSLPAEDRSVKQRSVF